MASRAARRSAGRRRAAPTSAAAAALVGEPPERRPAPRTSDHNIGRFALVRHLGRDCDEIIAFPHEQRAAQRRDEPLKRRDGVVAAGDRVLLGADPEHVERRVKAGGCAIGVVDGRPRPVRGGRASHHVLGPERLRAAGRYQLAGWGERPSLHAQRRSRRAGRRPSGGVVMPCAVARVGVPERTLLAPALPERPVVEVDHTPSGVNIIPLVIARYSRVQRGALLLVQVKRQRRDDDVGTSLQHDLEQAAPLVVEDLVAPFSG